MDDIFSRNMLYWGKEAQEKLHSSNVAVFGLGGVGGYCAEALCRSGIGKMTIVDFDTVSKSNINRQLIALNSTIGKEKTELFKTRLLDINPNLEVKIISDFYMGKMNFNEYDYVADAIDTMRSKISLLETCYTNNVKIISSMGAGNRIHPEMLYISDISEIHDKKAPFVSNVIYQLKKRNITSGITVVTSNEKPCVQEKITELENITTKSGENIQFNKIIPSSTPFVPPVAGFFMASRIVSDLINM